MTVLGANELTPGQEGFVQIRLEQPVVIQHGDRFILRFYSPMETLGGGMVLNPHPRRHKQATMQESLKNLGVLEKGTREDTLALFIAGKGLAGREENELIGKSGRGQAGNSAGTGALVQKKTVVRVDNLLCPCLPPGRTRENLSRPCETVSQGQPAQTGAGQGRAERRAQNAGFAQGAEHDPGRADKKKQLEMEGSKLRVPGFKAAGGKVNDEVKNRIVDAIKKGGTQPPVREELPGLFGITEKDAKDLLKLLADEGRTVRINDSLHLDREIWKRSAGI